jgi:hypothetical protein
MSEHLCFYCPDTNRINNIVKIFWFSFKLLPVLTRQTFQMPDLMVLRQLLVVMLIIGVTTDMLLIMKLTPR